MLDFFAEKCYNFTLKKIRGNGIVAVTFCALGSGSKGNSYLVAGNKNRILIDAGLTAKTIEGHLAAIGVHPAELDGILVTHEHSDHIAGIKVFAGRYDIPVYANEPTMLALLKKTGGLREKNIRIFTTGEDFFVGEFDITPFKTPHDSASSCGFSVYCRGSKVTVATDIGHMTRTVLNACKGSDILVLEANHDMDMLLNGPYSPFLKQRVQGPNGHLSNDVCGKTLAYLLDEGLKQVVLAHLSEENNQPQLAYSTVCAFLEERGATVGKDVLVDIAAQHQRGKCYRLI